MRLPLQPLFLHGLWHHRSSLQIVMINILDAISCLPVTWCILKLIFTRANSHTTTVMGAKQYAQDPTRYGFVGVSPCGSSPSRMLNIETSLEANETAVTSSLHGIMARWQHTQLINLRRGLGCGVWTTWYILREHSLTFLSGPLHRRATIIPTCAY